MSQQNQECHFLKIKQIQRQKSTRIWGIGVLGYIGGEMGYIYLGGYRGKLID